MKIANNYAACRHAIPTDKISAAFTPLMRNASVDQVSFQGIKPIKSNFVDSVRNFFGFGKKKTPVIIIKYPMPPKRGPLVPVPVPTRH